MKRKATKMTADKIRTLVTEAIIAALEAGTSPWQRPWTCNGDPMPHNCATGHVYRGINVPYLWAIQSLNEYSTAQWLTFKQCKKLGGHVLKGEKSTMVVFTKPFVVKKDDALPMTEKNKKMIFMLRTFPVFNIAQTEDVNLPARELPAEDDEAMPSDELLIDNVTEFVKEAGAVVKYNGGRAYFNPAKDMIGMPEPKRFKTADGFAATFLHELTHWTGHAKRLARVGITAGDGKGSETYAFEELVAEIGSAMLCTRFQCDGEVPNHASYIESWLKALKNDHSLIFKASKLAECAVEFLIPELRAERDAEYAEN